MFAKVYGAFSTPDNEIGPTLSPQTSRHGSSLSTSIASLLPDSLDPIETAAGPMYEPLPDNSWFRVLVIEPGDMDDPINCWLKSGRREDWNKRYEALSYSWKAAGAVETQTVICNGQEIPIQGNLYHALLHIRRTTSPRVIWADALCINQSNVSERSQQVQVMSAIYKSAGATLIWLGKETEEIVTPALNLVCQLVNAWDESSPAKYYIRDPFGTENIRKPTGSLHISPRTSIAAVSKLFLPLKTLFSVSWFYRRWIIQEIAFSSHTHVLFGNSRIRWSFVGLAAAILRTQHDGVVREWECDGIYNAYFIFRLAKSGPLGGIRPSFLQLLRLATNFETSEPRDVIFALLGIPTAENKRGREVFLLPDYELKMEDILKTVSEKLLGGNHPLAMLSNAGGIPFQETDDHGDLERLDIPTWMPTWTRGALSMMDAWTLDHCHLPSLNLSFKRFPTDDPRCLSLHGILLSPIIWLGPCMTEPVDTLHKYFISLLQSEAFSHLAWTERLKLLSVTLCAGRTHYGDVQTDKWFTAYNFAAWLSIHFDVPSIDPSGAIQERMAKAKAHRFTEAASVVSQNRRLFVTTGGHLGLGPPGALSGDVVAIIGGADMPFLLRRDGERWKLVGETYVDSVMNGEAVYSLHRGVGHSGLLNTESILDLMTKQLLSDEKALIEAERDLVVDLVKIALSQSQKQYSKLSLSRIDLI
jgi:hypothetical protein